MLRIVLPRVIPSTSGNPITTTDVGSVTSIYVCVAVAVVEVVVDRDVVISPAHTPAITAVAASTPHRTHHDAHSETNSGSGDYCACRIGRIDNGRIGINWWRTIDHRRAVAGYINYLRV